jgi:hypothetical protein
MSLSMLALDRIADRSRLPTVGWDETFWRQLHFRAGWTDAMDSTTLAHVPTRRLVESP